MKTSAVAGPIIVGYDGSPAARRALERVAALADRRTTIIVVGAMPVSFTSLGRVPPDPAERDEHARQLEEARAVLAAQGLRARTVQPHDDPANAIVAAARDNGAELILVGTHGRNLVGRLVLGSVSTKVLHQAPCDVLVVRPPAEHPPEAA